jgi:hypothetical protein
MTKRNQLAALAMIATMILAGCDKSTGGDSPDARRSAAVRYHQVLPMESMMDELVSQLVLQAPPEARADAKKMMLDGIDFNALRKLSIELMVTHFSAGEINSLTDFYASADGRSVMKKMPAYTAELMPLIQKEIIQAMPRPQQ